MERGSGLVLVQPEMERARFPLVSIPPFGQKSQGIGVYRSDEVWKGRRAWLARPDFIVTISPPGYHSAWLRPRRASFCFALGARRSHPAEPSIRGVGRWDRQDVSRLAKFSFPTLVSF